MKGELLYKELSYQIVGILFDVDNELGPGHKERVYQKAVAIAFSKAGIKYKEQVYIKLEYEKVNVGYYYLDFLVDDKIILELKRKPRFTKNDYDQVKKYLVANDLKLGILATFSHDGVKYERVLV